MQISSFKDNTELVQKVNEWCVNYISKYNAKSIYLPAGNTPKAIYKDWEQGQPNWLKELTFLQMDDVYKR